MNWSYTNIKHEARKELRISCNEYCVLDVIYKTHTHPQMNKDGWTDTSIQQIAEFFGLSKSTVHGIMDRMVKADLLEVKPDDPAKKRTTKKWYENAYKDAVQKTNVVRKPNGSVRKPNGERSETELLKEELKEDKINTHTQKPIYDYNDPFLFQKVANDMAAYLNDNPAQWQTMCEITGFKHSPETICNEWAGAQSDKPHVLANWTKHIGRLTTWMKNYREKNHNNGAYQNGAGRKEAAPAKAIEFQF